MNDRDKGPREFNGARQQLRRALTNSEELRSKLLDIKLENKVVKSVPRYVYDAEANAGYIHLSKKGGVLYTKELTDSIYVHYGHNEEVLGVELLHPLHPESDTK